MFDKKLKLIIGDSSDTVVEVHLEAAGDGGIDIVGYGFAQKQYIATLSASGRIEILDNAYFSES